MKTVFLTLCFIGCIVLSPVFLLSLSVQSTPITPAAIKTELVKIRLYDTAVNALQKQMDATTGGAEKDDPVAIIAPFVKKEITPTYIRTKIETLVDEADAWISGGTTPPVVSFSDLKEKLIKQNKTMLTELENAVTQMKTIQTEEGSQSTVGADPSVYDIPDVRKILSSDFTVPVGQYLSGLKLMMNISRYALYISGGLLAFNVLLIVLIASGLQSKLRWIGATFLFTALWNIPGALIGAGSSVMVSSVITQSLHGLASTLAKPLVESIVTPILLTYTRITGGVVIALCILGIGMLVLSVIAKPVEVVVSAKSSAGTRKTK